MEKDYFDFLVEHFNCAPGGSKEACLKVREFIQNSTIDQKGNIIPSKASAVDSNEFMEAVRVLMAFSWQKKGQDCVPERFVCDSDCSLNQPGFCPGEFQLFKKESLEKDGDGKVKAKRCPHFRDSWDI